MCFKALESRLLAIGGSRVQRLHDLDCRFLLEHGRQFETEERRKIRGCRRRCHHSVALNFAWRALSGRYPWEIVTGYALHTGSWVRQSWLWEGTCVLETTADFERYYGVILGPA